MIHFLPYLHYIGRERDTVDLCTGLEKFELNFSRCAINGIASISFVSYFMISAITSKQFQTEMLIDLAWFHQYPWSVSPSSTDTGLLGIVTVTCAIFTAPSLSMT